MVSCASTRSVLVLPFRFGPMKSHTIEDFYLIQKPIDDWELSWYWGQMVWSSTHWIDPILDRSGLIWVDQELFLEDQDWTCLFVNRFGCTRGLCESILNQCWTNFKLGRWINFEPVWTKALWANSEPVEWRWFRTVFTRLLPEKLKIFWKLDWQAEENVGCGRG